MARIGLDARYIYADHFHGIGRVSLNLVRHLASLPSDHEFVVFKRADYGEALGAAGSRVREVSCRPKPVSLGTWFFMEDAVQRQRLDLFHALFPVMPLRIPAPTIVTVHDLQAIKVEGFSGKRPEPVATVIALFYRLAYKMSMRRARHIIAVSEATRQDIMRTYHLPADRITVVYNGVDSHFNDRRDDAARDRVRRKYGLPARYLLNVGNSRPHKNWRGMIRGYQLYRHLADAPMPLVMVGVRDRFFDEAAREAQQLGLAGQVLFPGYVADDDLPHVYQMADLFVAVSFKEGFGLPVVEAMACGTPVLVSNVDSLPEVVGSAGQMVNPASPAEIGMALLRLLQAPATLADLRQRCVERARFFSWERCARGVLAVYEQLLQGH